MKHSQQNGKNFQFEQRLVATIPGYQTHHFWNNASQYVSGRHVGWCPVRMGIIVCGLQIVTTVLTSYTVDCHRHQALAVSQFVSLVRQTLSFTVPFFNPPLNDRVGYAGGFGIEASILAVFYSLSLIIYWKGDRMRIKYPVRRLETSDY
ncbi:hypothetical protein MAP00_006557 [Monascus purpureus]|nr:hypothetical protein MAP00_006557 [Monascus purpureus]